MPRERKKPPKKPRSRAQAVFLENLQRVMEARDLSQNALSKLYGAPPQRTISGVISGADPSLGTVQKLCDALQINVVEMLTDRFQSVRKVTQISPFPSMMGGRADKQGDRKKRGG